jgi:hypothetical protein
MLGHNRGEDLEGIHGLEVADRGQRGTRWGGGGVQLPTGLKICS